VPEGTTEWLGYAGRIPNLPMNTEIISIDSLVPGEHTLTLRPEGRVSGCNTAGIAAWDGSIQLYSNFFFLFLKLFFGKDFEKEKRMSEIS